jgi:3-isopropylmalate dehydratase small subunit
MRYMVIILHKGQVECRFSAKISRSKFAIAKSYARIGWQNLINLALFLLSLRIHQTGKLEQGDVLNIEGLRAAIKNNDLVTATVRERY